MDMDSVCRRRQKFMFAELCRVWEDRYREDFRLALMETYPKYHEAVELLDEVGIDGIALKSGISIGAFCSVDIELDGEWFIDVQAGADMIEPDWLESFIRKYTETQEAREAMYSREEMIDGFMEILEA